MRDFSGVLFRQLVNPSSKYLKALPQGVRAGSFGQLLEVWNNEGDAVIIRRVCLTLPFLPFF